MADKPASRPRLSRDAYVLGIVAFFVMVGFGVVVPVLPVYARSFGVGYFEVGVVLSAFALMRLISSPFVPRLIDFLGERAILAAGVFIVAVSSALSGLAMDYPQLLLLRAAGGVGSAMFSVSSMTLLLNTSAPSLRARSMGFYQGGFLIGGMAGPAVGGVLATISLTAPFFFYAGTLAVAGVIGLILLTPKDKTLGADQDRSATPVPFRTVLRDVRYQAACLANFAQGWTSFGVRSALVPLLVVEVLREPNAWTGMAFAIAAVAQTVALAPASRFVDTVGRRPAIVASFAVSALIIIAVPYAPNVWVLTALLCVYGVCSAFMSTAPGAVVGDVAGHRTGRPVAVFSMVADLGAIVGPLVAGALADSVSYGLAFAVGAAFLLLAALFALRMPRRAPLAD